MSKARTSSSNSARRRLLSEMRDVAADFVRGGYDVILTWTTSWVIAASRATSTIPIVFVGVTDPVGQGLVAGLARPGANVTGIANFASDLSGKMIELLREIVPDARRLGAVRNPDNPGVAFQLSQLMDAARALGLEFQVVDARVPAEFEAAFAQLRQGGIQGVVMVADSSVLEHADAIAALAQQARLPTVFQRRENVEAGGLLSMGRTSGMRSAKSPATSTAFSRGSGPPTSRSSNRPRSSW
jgi:putative tryptophan/tyrosine transport system substrate-binding protein